MINEINEISLAGVGLRIDSGHTQSGVSSVRCADEPAVLLLREFVLQRGRDWEPNRSRRRAEDPSIRRSEKEHKKRTLLAPSTGERAT